MSELKIVPPPEAPEMDEIEIMDRLQIMMMEYFNVGRRNDDDITSRLKLTMAPLIATVIHELIDSGELKLC